MALNAARWRLNGRLQEAASNHPPMRVGETGMPVRLLQQALIDLGFPLPRSTRRYNTVDGIYGAEVRDKIKAYQSARGISSDGVAGRDTLNQMDIDVSALPDPPPLPPLPGASHSSSTVDYSVPGTILPVRQDSGKRCWAAMYAAMLQWRRQQSMTTRAAVVTLGEPYTTFYDTDTALHRSEQRPCVTRRPDGASAAL